MADDDARIEAPAPAPRPPAPRSSAPVAGPRVPRSRSSWCWCSARSRRSGGRCTAPPARAWLASWVPRLDDRRAEGLAASATSPPSGSTSACPARAGTLRLDAPRWHALGVARGSDGRWLHLTIETLHADRVVLLPATTAAPATSEPARAAGDAAPADRGRDPRARASTSCASAPMRALPPCAQLHARVHLGAEGGAAASLRRPVGELRRRARHGQRDDRRRRAVRGRREARRRLGRRDARMAGQRRRERPARGARHRRHGARHADARRGRRSRSTAAPSSGRSRRGRSATLRVATQDLDLSAFASAAPTTSLSGEATATTQRARPSGASSRSRSRNDARRPLERRPACRCGA